MTRKIRGEEKKNSEYLKVNNNNKTISKYLRINRINNSSKWKFTVCKIKRWVGRRIEARGDNIRKEKYWGREEDGRGWQHEQVPT